MQGKKEAIILLDAQHENIKIKRDARRARGQGFA